MRKIFVTHKRLLIAFYTILLICSLLLCACTVQPDDQSQTQPMEATTPAEAPGATQDTHSDITEPDADESADLSLLIFRQAMVETPQLFAAAFFGNVPQGANPFTVMQESTPQLCKDLPFILSIDPNHVIGTEGQLFCVVPADENATVAVNRRPWNAGTESYEEPEVLYRSESGSPILILCPNNDWIPDTEVVLTDSRGTVTVWSPHLDPDYRIAALRNENGEDLIFDFTSYDELSSQDWNQ